MNNITINGKQYEMDLGLAFIQELDKRYAIDVKGIQFGMGVALIQPQLQMGSIIALVDFIQAATCTLRNQPSKNDIESFLIAEDTDLMELADSFTKAFNDSPAVKKATQYMVQKMAANQGKSVEEVMAGEEQEQDKVVEMKTAKRPTKG